MERTEVFVCLASLQKASVVLVVFDPIALGDV
jgi:hypothetical protein